MHKSPTAANDALLQACFSPQGPHVAEANAALDHGADPNARNSLGTTALINILKCFPQHYPGEEMVQRQTNRDEGDAGRLV